MRDLSPTRENSPTDSGTKKLKSPEPAEKCTSTSSRTNLESTDNTQFTVTSGGPKPFTRGPPNIPSDASPPNWAQPMLAMITAMMKEIHAIRADIATLQKRDPNSEKRATSTENNL